VSRTGGSYGAASVNYATANGSATAGSDYTTTTGTLNWADSDTGDKHFDVPITDDALSEASETFTASLSGATGAPLGTPTTTTVTITDDEPPSDLALAVDCDSLTWTTGGDADWFSQAVVTHDGEDAAQSGAIANGQESWMETTVIGPGTVTFWWKVSSEADCDYLEFYTGTTLQDRISGDVDWQQQAYAVDPGVQTLRWRYVKDGASSEGSDCGWVDQVVFVEGGIPALEGLGDFNGDGFSDLLIREMLGPVWVRLMTGAATDQIGSPGSPDTTWVVEALGDFNNDRMTDILWRNALTSDVAIWLMNGTAIGRAGLVGTPLSDWAVHGIADFNGDGRDDILWRNAATDQVAIWIMRGTRLIGGRVTAAVNSDWQVRGTGDFNGNGKGDVLWQNTATGDVAIWLMDGTTIRSAGIVACVDPASGWIAAGVGDLNGDGKSDIVWYHEGTRQLAGWIMNGLRRRSADLIKDFTTGLAVTVPAGWAVQGIGDFNNNGKDDLLLHNSATGELQIWYMNKLRRLGVGTPDSLW
jgi:hypothetical protein